MSSGNTFTSVHVLAHVQMHTIKKISESRCDRMCGSSQVPVSVDREGSDHRNAAVNVGGSLVMKFGNTLW
jgi:hypothetical protein